MAEQKAVCGGFLVGEGLKMEGKVLSAEGGGGSIRIYNVEKLNTGDEYDEFIIHGMSLDDIVGFYYFHGVEEVDASTYSIITCPYAYILEQFHSPSLNEDRDGFAPIGDIASFGYFTEPEEYLDGIKVKRPN